MPLVQWRSWNTISTTDGTSSTNVPGWYQVTNAPTASVITGWANYTSSSPTYYHGYLPFLASHAALNQYRYANDDPQVMQAMRQSQLVSPRPLAAPAIIQRRGDRGREDALERRVDRDWQQRNEEARARALERAAADRLAMELLRSHLNPDQRRMLDAAGLFIVVAPSGARYRIRCGVGVVANIDAMEGEGDRVTHRLCCHLRQGLPMGDHLLAQKIMLEHAEGDFLRIANRHGVLPR